MESPGSTPANAVTGIAGLERVRAFDLAAGLAVFFMILVHVLWHWGAPATWTTPAGTVISLLGGPTGAPTFMFLMGASLAFSSRSTLFPNASTSLTACSSGREHEAAAIRAIRSPG
jgi:uncharacterized membrane protein